MQNQRLLFFQIHCGINIGCLVITLISIIALRFSIGIIEITALLAAIVGVLAFYLNDSTGRRRKVLKEYYLAANLASLLSIVLVSQILFRFVVLSTIYRLLYLGITLVPLIAILYFVFYGQYKVVQIFFNPVYLVVAAIVGIILSSFVFKIIIANFFPVSFLMYMSYFLVVFSLLIGFVIGLDLRLLIYKGR